METISRFRISIELASENLILMKVTTIISTSYIHVFQGHVVLVVDITRYQRIRIVVDECKSF